MLSSRRSFLFKASSLSLSLLAANATIYAVGSAFKNIDGSLVAGAKSCTGPAPNCNGACWYTAPDHSIKTGHMCDAGAVCNTGTGNWNCDGGYCQAAGASCN